jgi:hypothetical protein
MPILKAVEMSVLLVCWALQVNAYHLCHTQVLNGGKPCLWVADQIIFTASKDDDNEVISSIPCQVEPFQLWSRF